MSDTSPISRPWQVEIAFKVQTYDIDFAGIVSNITYIRWLEDLRLKVLEENYPILNMLDDGYAPFLARTDISYKRGITIYDKPTNKFVASFIGSPPPSSIGTLTIGWKRSQLRSTMNRSTRASIKSKWFTGYE